MDRMTTEQERATIRFEGNTLVVGNITCERKIIFYSQDDANAVRHEVESLCTDIYRLQELIRQPNAVLSVPKEIKFEWSLKDGGPTLECTVNGRAVGFVWHNTLADWYVSHKIMGTDRYETEAEARAAVEQSCREWIRGVYGM